MNGPLPRVDAVIVGGGLAGLWLLNVLRSRGYGVLLLEAKRLGGGQTLASQGLVHGGLKYALAGRPTLASEALAEMPDRWRICLAGTGEVDLSGISPASEHCHLFADGGLGKLRAFFAAKGLRGRIEKLPRQAHPAALQADEFQGWVYRANDLALDASALVARLAALGAGHIYRCALQSSACALGDEVRLTLGPASVLAARRLILAAGDGNQALLDGLGIDGIAMQRRPLHQAVVRHPNLPPLFGHCLTGIRRPEPRLTISSHPDGPSRRWLWQLGGQLAADGIRRSASEQRCRARQELQACFPWMDWSESVIETHRIDRAESRQPGGRRPEGAFAAPAGPCIVCWPTKLALIPDLADQVLQLLPPPAWAEIPKLNLPAPELGSPPWEA